MSPHLTAAITRSLAAIPALRFEPTGVVAREADALEMLNWMSWQPLEQFPMEVRETFPALAQAGRLELLALTGRGGPTHVRLAVRPEARTGERDL